MIVGLLHQGAGDRHALLLAARRLSARCAASRPMSNCSSAESAIARSASVQSPASDRQAGTWFSRPTSTLVMHVEPADQVELLEDHGAVGAPVPQRPARAAR